ncbi:hypothetical protein BST30_01910 [Mycobacterium mantenii]|uniref:T4 beta protein n=1 Tax=Mycobacterium mantenii TaxID=560555 RepID=A0A1X0G4P6_MYCNT|nr:hypothetical protein BST30_01910 [Mycobacterium mantenii]
MYVAILKAKQGELLAIQSTSPKSFVPLIEMPTAEKASAVIRTWPHSDDVIWVHPLNVTGIEDAEWVAEVAQSFATLRDGNRVAVPVVTTSDDAAVLDAVRTITGRDRRGLVLRLDCEDALAAGRDGLTSDIDDVLAACEVPSANCDLVIDAGLVDGGPAVQASVTSSVLAILPYLQDWRSLVVAFSAFPEVVGNIIAPGTVGSIPRTDAASFTYLTSTWRDRELTFADYGVGVPTYADTPYAPIPNIRYALPGEWRVHRAQQRRDPSPQYVALARDVVRANYFGGADFSPGDQYINNVANGSDGPGNAGSYLRAAMSRHFHVVLDSLATQGAP